MHDHHRIYTNNSGQVLLITIMVLATVSTIILTATYQSVNQTRITKLQEDNQKALAAAEAGIERVIALQNTQQLTSDTASYKDLGLDNLDSVDQDNSTIEVTTIIDSEIVSPTIEKDETFTFYLADYNNQTFSNYYNDDITLYAGTDGTHCSSRTMPALELIFLHDTTSDMERHIVEPCTSGNYISPADITTLAGGTLKGESFDFKTVNINVPLNAKLLVIRVLFGETKVGFRANAGSFPPQGRYIVSEAQLTTGVTKVVELVQLYPQIPSTFLFTSF